MLACLEGGYSVRFTTILGFALVLLFDGALMPRARAGDIPELLQAAGKSTYPESAEGLKSLLQDVFASVKGGDVVKSSGYLAAFSIPNHEAWFLKTFGSSEGPRLEARYKELQPKYTEWLQKRVEQAMKDCRTEIGVNLIEKPEDTQMRLMRAVLGALAQPIKIYMASDSKSTDDKSPFYLGEFVYVDGGFRYLDRPVLQALSTAPPMRITLGGNVQRERLVQKVQPEYPQDAKDGKIQGTVVLHVILGTDGSVQQIQVVSGHPLLVQSALDAVRQWRYQPTLLNGQAVEVDTQINVIFSLQP
jgi:TonB family protein